MTRQLLTKIKEVMPQKIGRIPVVVLPLEMWKKVEYSLEDLEMAESQTLAKKITKARKEKKLHPASEVRRTVGIQS